MFHLNNFRFGRLVNETEQDNYTPNQGWRDTNTNKLNKYYQINGKKYQVLRKKERNLPFTSFQRIARIMLGVLITIGSIGIAPLVSKSVRRLFSSQQNILIVKEVQAVNSPNLINVNSYKDDFQKLQQETPTITYLDPSLYTVRWGHWIRCPSKTAIPIMYEGKTQYIHANKVDMEDASKYIAIQAPGSEHLDLFLQLVNDEVSMIVDLTNPKDKEKDKFGIDAEPPIPYLKKRYFPKQVNKQRDLKYFTVTCTNVNDLENVSIYTYAIKEKRTGSIKTIKRIHYKNWPDHGVIDTDTMLGLVKTINTLALEQADGRIMVHCRGGVGRTGTLITARTLYNLKEADSITVDTFKSKTRDIILHGREQRGPQFVQQAIQLKSIYEFGNKIFDKSNT